MEKLLEINEGVKLFPMIPPENISLNDAPHPGKRFEVDSNKMKTLLKSNDC